MRWQAPFLWTVLTPLAIRLVGYYPGKRLGMLDVDRLGHFGFFRKNRVDLWDEIALPILASLPAETLTTKSSETGPM